MFRRLLLSKFREFPEALFLFYGAWIFDRTSSVTSGKSLCLFDLFTSKVLL